MVGIQTPVGMSRFTYDAAGRLTGSDTPHAGQQRWRFDPAGNRLPITGPATAPTVGEAITGELNETDRLRAQQRAQDKASPVSKEQIQHSDYNALQGKDTNSNSANPQATQKWAGNRVAYYENSEDASSEGSKIHYQYDSRGNRTNSFDETKGRKMDLSWDKGNQLVQVIVQEEGKHFTQSYRYDAFGRRLAKYNDPNNIGEAEESGTDYFGWDGDRLIHTERFNESNHKTEQGTPLPEVIHTIYEPGSFTPLIQLTQEKKSEPDFVSELLAQMPQDMVKDALSPMLENFSATHAQVNEVIDDLDMHLDAKNFIKSHFSDFSKIRKKLIDFRKIRYHLCNSIGTPVSLINSKKEIVWTAFFDSWGAVKNTYKLQNVCQPIRFPGQHADADVGIYYNRNRYYDCERGAYISQDPIGLTGGVNLAAYTKNPNQYIDPMGLTDNSSPWSLGTEWLTGTGPAHRNFVDGDPFAEMLKQHKNIQNLLKAACSGKMENGRSLPNQGKWDYSVGGVDGVFLYLQDYSNILTAGNTGNLAVTFLGSYNASYKISQNILTVTAKNSSTIQSATHPPIVGYTKWWEDNVGNPLNKMFDTGPMSEKTQTITMTFDLTCDCK